jgi:non-specific serine/threonine protein kinase
MTPFFGREEEIARLRQLLEAALARARSEDARAARRLGASGSAGPALVPGLAEDSRPRLVTITGPPGIGKTRLAVETARRLEQAFQGALWFVPLADLPEPDLILDRVRGALGLPPHVAGERPLQAATRMLSRQPSLLVVDNFEHLVERGTSLLLMLIAEIPALTCLVTSRRRLDVAGEQEFPLAPLPTPRGRLLSAAGRRDPDQLARLSGIASVGLFLQRVRSRKPDFRLSEGNAALIAEICCRLEGVPLAIELAAGRMRNIELPQLWERLKERLDFPPSRQRDVDPRHRSLYRTIQWSFDLLSPELQRVFLRLGVFHGGCMPAAAAFVCFGREEEPEATRQSCALDGLDQLCDCSLLQMEEVGNEVRYRLLEMLREFAWAGLQQSGEEEDASRRHALFFLDLAERAGVDWNRSTTTFEAPCAGRWRTTSRSAFAWRLPCSPSGPCAATGPRVASGWRRLDHVAPTSPDAWAPGYGAQPSGLPSSRKITRVPPHCWRSG